MHVFEGKEKALITEIETILFRDKATFNSVIRAFARGAVPQLDNCIHLKKKDHFVEVENYIDRCEGSRRRSRFHGTVHRLRYPHDFPALQCINVLQF